MSPRSQMIASPTLAERTGVDSVRMRLLYWRAEVLVLAGAAARELGDIQFLVQLEFKT